MNTENPICPPSEKDLAITGWKMQRRRHELERAEAAQRAEAVATGRVVRGGTYRVVLPPEYSTNPESERAADCEYVTLPHSGQLAEVVAVTLSTETRTDPRNVWDWPALLAKLNYAAARAARSMRAAPADAEDAAARVVADLVSKSHGGAVLRSTLPAEAIGAAVKNKLAEAIAARESETPDGETFTDAGAAAEAEDVAEMQRAQRDADPMLDLSVSPFSEDVDAALAGLTQGERDALRVDAAGMRPAEIAATENRKPGAVRVSVHKGRAKLASRSPEDAEALADALRPDHTPTPAEISERRARAGLRFLSTGPLNRAGDPEPIGHTRPLKQMPDRMPARSPEETGDALTIAHAPVAVRVMGPARKPQA